MNACYYSDRALPVPVDLANIRRVRAIHEQAVREDWYMSQLINALLDAGHVPVINYRQINRKK